MKISDIKGKQALEVMDGLIDPLTKILADTEVRDAARINRIQAIRLAVRKYPDEIILILALLEGEDPDAYEPSLLSIPKKLIEITEDEDVQMLFTSAVQTAEEEHSTDA